MEKKTKDLIRVKNWLNDWHLLFGTDQDVKWKSPHHDSCFTNNYNSHNENILELAGNNNINRGLIFFRLII